MQTASSVWNAKRNSLKERDLLRLTPKPPEANSHKHTMKAAQSFRDARSYAILQLSNHTPPMVAKEIEKSIVDYTKKSCVTRKLEMRWSVPDVRRLYIRKLRMILNNMNPLLTLARNKEIALCEFAFVDHQRMRPDIYKPILDMMERREKLTMLVDAQEDEDYQGLLKCECCGSFRTTYVTLQTRSADEPETVYMKCFACGKNDTIRG